MADFHLGDRVRVRDLPTTAAYAGRVGSVVQPADGTQGCVVCLDDDGSGAAPVGRVVFQLSDLEALSVGDTARRLAATGVHQGRRAWSQRPVGIICWMVGIVALLAVALFSAGLLLACVDLAGMGAIPQDGRSAVSTIILSLFGLLILSMWLLVRVLRGGR